MTVGLDIEEITATTCRLRAGRYGDIIDTASAIADARNRYNRMSPEERADPERVADEIEAAVRCATSESGFKRARV